MEEEEEGGAVVREYIIEILQDFCFDSRFFPSRTWMWYTGSTSTIAM